MTIVTKNSILFFELLNFLKLDKISILLEARKMKYFFVNKKSALAENVNSSCLSFLSDWQNTDHWKLDNTAVTFSKKIINPLFNLIKV